MDKVCEIVRKQLALPEESPVTGESKFSQLGADSLDTVLLTYLHSILLPLSLSLLTVLHYTRYRTSSSSLSLKPAITFSRACELYVIF